MLNHAPFNAMGNIAQNGLAYRPLIKVSLYGSPADKDRNVPLPGYPKVYNALAAFGSFGALTEVEFASLDVAQVSERMDAFIVHVSAIEGYPDLGQVNEYIDYAPDTCRIADELRVIMAVVTDLDGINTAPATFFIIGGISPRYSSPQTTARGNLIECIAEDLSAGGKYVFEGWFNAAVKLSDELIYDFIIDTDTTLVARWKSTDTGVTLLLLKGVNILSVEGGGTYPVGKTVTARAALVDGASFAGWFKNGTLVSSNPAYVFSLNEYTELEARGKKDEYKLEVIANGKYASDKRFDFPAKGEDVTVSKSVIEIVTVKNASFFDSVVVEKPDWITLLRRPVVGKIVYTAGFDNNRTTAALSGLIKIIQNESGKTEIIQVNQAKSTNQTTGKYVWVLNDNDCLQIELGHSNMEEVCHSYFVNPAESPYLPENRPKEEPTDDDFFNGVREGERYYRMLFIVTWDFPDSNQGNTWEFERDALFYWEAKPKV